MKIQIEVLWFLQGGPSLEGLAWLSRTQPNPLFSLLLKLNELVVGDTSGKLSVYKNDDSRPWLTCSCQGMVSIQPWVPPVEALSKLGAPIELPSVCSATSSWFGAHLSQGGEVPRQSSPSCPTWARMHTAGLVFILCGGMTPLVIHGSA